MALASVCFLVMLPTACAAALTEGPRLAAIYDTILEAGFDRADAQLRAACPPAPEEACKALGVVSIWWQILLDPESRLLDARLTDRAGAAIAASEAWTRREPGRAEAWFYLAGSYAPLVQWRALRGERLAAARDANRIRETLERALALDPTLNDAYFGIGLYHYYADVVPATLKLVRWLLLLPGGDRVKGLREMLQAREHGQVLTGEADYQLHWIYLWYEKKPDEALDLLARLDRQYPSNPLFLQRIAEVQEEYFHDHPASERAWQTLLDRARHRRVDPHATGLAETRARLGLAFELDAMFETDRAIEQLADVAAAQPVAPYGAQARAELRLGAAYDRLGDRTRAVSAYKEAIALAGSSDPLRIAERARTALRHAPDPRRAEAYRLSLDGWRSLERGDLDRAESLLARAVQLAPADPMTQYRYARALAARGDHEQARSTLERVLAMPDLPAIVLASAYVDCAALLERAGENARALQYYREALRTTGGDPRARDRAEHAIRRLAAHARG